MASTETFSLRDCALTRGETYQASGLLASMDMSSLGTTSRSVQSEFTRGLLANVCVEQKRVKN
eukprot:3452374-Amphidinium_carterae.2